MLSLVCLISHAIISNMEGYHRISLEETAPRKSKLMPTRFACSSFCWTSFLAPSWQHPPSCPSSRTGASWPNRRLDSSSCRLWMSGWSRRLVALPWLALRRLLVLQWIDRLELRLLGRRLWGFVRGCAECHLVGFFLPSVVAASVFGASFSMVGSAVVLSTGAIFVVSTFCSWSL